MVLMVGYDLNKPGQEYEDLMDAIKGYGTWWHHLDSTWFIETNDSPAGVREHLQQFIDNGDELLVIRAVENWSAIGFEQRAYDWLEGRDW
jgi:hypothetical protein